MATFSPTPGDPAAAARLLARARRGAPPGIASELAAFRALEAALRGERVRAGRRFTVRGELPRPARPGVRAASRRWSASGGSLRSRRRALLPVLVASLGVAACSPRTGPIAHHATRGILYQLEGRTTPASTRAQAYRVAPGDTLYALSARFYGDPGRWHDLFVANRQIVRDPHWLRPGQRLVIRLWDARLAPPSVMAKAPGAHRFYRVRPGDTLYTIARARLGDARRWWDIYRANRAWLRDPRHIQPKMYLALPLGAPAAMPAQRVGDRPVGRQDT